MMTSGKDHRINAAIQALEEVSLVDPPRLSSSQKVHYHGVNTCVQRAGLPSQATTKRPPSIS